MKNDIKKCKTCRSDLIKNYNPFPNGQTEGSCEVTNTNAAQYIISVGKNTVSGTSELKSVTFDTNTVFASGSLSNIGLYSLSVIDFVSLLSNSVVFKFDLSALIHQKVIVKTLVYT